MTAAITTGGATMSKNFVISVVVMFIVSMVLGFLVHGLPRAHE
jgi:hypothetical protein